jgi:pyruvate kinase
MISLPLRYHRWNIESTGAGGRLGTKQRLTKIVATWGPAVASEERLRAIVDAGVDVFRLNFSHATHAELEEAVPRIRAVADSAGRQVALLQDIQGPRLRTGLLPDGAPVLLETGSSVTIMTEEGPTSATCIVVAYPQLTDDVHEGDRVLIADGTITLRVTSVGNGSVEAVVVNGGMLGEHKGVNLPDSFVSAEPLTERDREDLAFGASIGVDYVALSFVRRASDISACRVLLHDLGSSAPIIAKIEHPQAIANLEEILAASDGVMVARGDLGVEVSAERVPLLQKLIIRRANELGIPVITATQMLESMIEKPVPTRAEASDIANAVLDGTDALMLSGESAVGSFPVEAVETMARIAMEAEETGADHTRHEASGQLFAMARAARELASHLRAQAILVFTRSGQTAQTLSQQKPDQPIFALTGSPEVCRQLSLWYGIWPVLADVTEEVEAMIGIGMQRLRELEVAGAGDLVVILGTSPVAIGGLPNMISVRSVSAA